MEWAAHEKEPAEVLAEAAVMRRRAEDARARAESLAALARKACTAAAETAARVRALRVTAQGHR